MYAVITGASSGIGLECAKLLAKKGYGLILTARRTERLMQLQNRIQQKYGVHVLLYPCDLEDSSNVMKLHAFCSAYPVKVVVNNAGFGKVGEFTETNLEEELAMIDVNVKAVHILTKLFAQSMQAGYILNVASVAGYQPVPLMASYGATKAYVLNLSKAVNYELKRSKKKIHVAAFCPGPVDTEFDQRAGVRYSLNHISAKECAKAGIVGMFRRQTEIFPITTTKLASRLSKLAPDWITLPVEYFLQNKKR